MLRFLSVPFAAFALVSGLALAPLRPAVAEPLFTSTVPDWVIPLAVPPADPALLAVVTDGVLTLLSDEQVQWDGEERQVFVRSARLVVDEGGLATAGRIELTFAPESETVLLGRVAVIRGGQVIDLTETAVTQTLENDLPLAAAGRVAATVQVPDVQVGDVVEVAYLRRQLPVLAGINRAGLVQLEQDVPVVLAQVVVNWPESWPIYISGWPARVAFVQQTAPGIIRHTWSRQGHIPPQPEPLLPPGHSENTVIAYSAFPDWSGVTAVLSAHYMESYPLGAEWDGKLRTIQADFDYAGDRAMAALRAVQDDLRYEEMPLAANGWLARLPADVTAAGEGDAKAKALLLRAMLDKMGIEAYVALTHRTQGHDLNGQKPAFGAFDHAIVKAVIDDTFYWFDPSASQQGGDFYSLSMPDYGFALPLSGGDQQQLEQIDTGYTSTPSTYIEESYDFTLLGAYVTVVTTHYGPAADAFRQDQNNPDSAGAQGTYPEIFAARYPDLRVLAPVLVTDDRITNQFMITERYLIPATSLASLDLFAVESDNLLAFLPSDLNAAGRVAPLYLGQPFNRTHRISLFNMPVPTQAPVGASIYGDTFSFAFSGYESAPGDLTLEWTYDQYLRSVPPASVDQLLRDAAQIDGNIGFAFNLRP